MSWETDGFELTNPECSDRLEHLPLKQDTPDSVYNYDQAPRDLPEVLTVEVTRASEVVSATGKVPDIWTYVRDTKKPDVMPKHPVSDLEVGITPNLKRQIVEAATVDAVWPEDARSRKDIRKALEVRVLDQQRVEVLPKSSSRIDTSTWRPMFRPKHLATDDYSPLICDTQSTTHDAAVDCSLVEFPK